MEKKHKQQQQKNNAHKYRELWHTNHHVTFRVQMLEHFINIARHVVAVLAPVIARVVILKANEQALAEFVQRLLALAFTRTAAATGAAAAAAAGTGILAAVSWFVLDLLFLAF